MRAADYLARPVSVYARANANRGTMAPLLTQIERVQADANVRLLTARAREALAAGSNEAYRVIKSRLPAPAFAGVFAPTRAAANLAQHSGVLTLDYDHVDAAEALRGAAAEVGATLTAFVSPSGEGVKVNVALTPTPADASEHAFAYSAALHVYARLLPESGADQDATTRDVSRLCFLAHDPNVYVASAVEPLRWRDVGVPAPVPPQPAAPREPAEYADGVFADAGARALWERALRNEPVSAEGSRNANGYSLLKTAGGLAAAGRADGAALQRWVMGLLVAGGLPAPEIASLLRTDASSAYAKGLAQPIESRTLPTMADIAASHRARESRLSGRSAIAPALDPPEPDEPCAYHGWRYAAYSGAHQTGEPGLAREGTLYCTFCRAADAAPDAGA